MAAFRVMVAAAVVLTLGCETRPHSTTGSASRPAPSGTAPVSAPSVVPEIASAEVIPLDDWNAFMAEKRRAADAMPPGRPERWASPLRLTTSAGCSLRSPHEPVVYVGLGAGWGCAELDATGERHRVCWLASSVAKQARGKVPVRAQRVPWLTGSAVVTAERLCARVGGELACWPAPQVLEQAPADIPEPKAWRRETASEPPVAIAAAPSFECEVRDGVLGCHGSDPFAMLTGDPKKVDDALGWPYLLALGHHHGCVRRDLDILCWGRGDHGELGYEASGRCQDGANEVACSHQLGRARVQGESESHPPLLVAGDTYSCAVTDHFVECWGKSRDAFFPAPGPARVPGLRLNASYSLSAGPRGLCGDDYDGRTRCVGAIPAPPPGVSRVAVSQGDDASACGADADGIVCWGEAYSPPGRTRAPVRIRFDDATGAAAPVLDTPGRWDADCDIKRPCTRDWTKPPLCGASPEAVPWATLARDAVAQRGKLVSVMGNFVVGPVSTTLAGCWRSGPDQLGREPANVPTLCCNGSWAPIGLVSEGLALRLEGLECAGDESRLCCSAPATGQGLVATGLLEWENNRGDSGWMLRDPKLCSLD